MKKILMSLCLGVLLAGPFQAANALVLGNWNDPDLQSSGDTVNVTTGTFSDTLTYFSLQFVSGGSNNGLTALGIDTVFYNSSSPVLQVWSGGIGTGTDITSLWSTNYGGTTGGGGFGDFLSQKNLQGGGTYGISAPIYFVLSDLTTFAANTNGAMFDVHIRYSNSCSGWVSDGQTSSMNTSGSCGSSSVPEPSSLLLLGMGLLGIGLVRRRKA